MSDHVCKCFNCAPELRSPSPDLPGFRDVRHGLDHWGIRFGTADHQWVYFTLNGEPIRGVVEALVGENGWAFMWTDHEKDFGHVCRTCNPTGFREFDAGGKQIGPDPQICARIVRGHIAVERITPHPQELANV